MQDLLRTSGEAWAAWLRDGSREDWSDRLRSIDAPAVVISGGQDGDLGSAAQPRLNGPFYPQARFVTLPGAGTSCRWNARTRWPSRSGPC